jgi:hypothetical protein
MILASGAVLLLLTGLMIFQDVRRKNIVKSTRFSEQYARVIDKLRGSTDSVQKKMRRNEVVTAVVVEISREPAPGQRVAGKNRSFVLQGISWSVDKPLVMIDDKLYKEGDSIGGYTIEKIFQQAIILRGADGAQRKITLLKEPRP